MVCPKCGAEISDNAYICIKCLADLRQDDSTELKIPLWIKITVPSVIGLIVLVISFFVICNSLWGYKSVASRYAKALHNGNWDVAFSMANLQRDPFINVDAYKETMKEIDKGKISDLKVTSEKIAEDDSSFNVKVEYTTARVERRVDEYILEKTEYKHLGIFSDYKVSVDSVIAKNINIQVPKGTKVYINDIFVIDKYVDSREIYRINTDSYVIPNLFIANYDVRVESDYAKDYVEPLFVKKDNDSILIDFSKLKYKTEQLDNLKQKSINDLKQIADCAVKGNKEFSDTGIAVVESQIKTVENAYNNGPYSSCHLQTRNVIKMELDNIKCELDSSNVKFNDEEVPMIKATLTYDVSGTYISKMNSTIQNGSRQNSSSTIYYAYEDGEWKVSSISIFINIF